MRRKRSIKERKTMLVLIAIIVAVIAVGTPKPVQSAVNRADLAYTYFNSAYKYLYLGGQGANTYDFNINNDRMEHGATYFWYVKVDKGNPDSVTINKKTGTVTAKKAGTAYIRCKVTLTDGTVLRPEAKVTVWNNITEVEINNIPKDLTITAGMAKDFNRDVLNTAAGKAAATQGITRWEITDDTAKVDNATTKGIVFPMKEGSFKIRAVSFQSNAKYKLWLEDKEANAGYITAVSDWYTIKVLSSNGIATVSTGEQLNKALLADNINQITITTEKALTFTIPEGNYFNKTLIVNAANSDVENYGVFKEIRINAIKDNTWIEYEDGNIIYLNDDVVSFVIDTDAKVKRIVIDKSNSTLNLEIKGRVEQIIVTQPSQINVTGSGGKVPVTVEETAGGTTITTSMPLDFKLKARTDILLKVGAEETTLDKSESTVLVKVDNNSDRKALLTTGNRGGELVGAGETLVSGEAVSTIPPILSPTSTVISVTVNSGPIMVIQGGTRQLTAVVDVVGGQAQTVIWSSNDINGKVTVSKTGLLTIAKDALPALYTITAKSTIDTGKSDTVTIIVIDPLTVTDIEDTKTAGEIFDISGSISGYKNELGIMADGEYSVTVRNNDSIIFGPTMVAFTNGTPSSGININLTSAGENTLLVQVDEDQDTTHVTIDAAAPNHYGFLEALDHMTAGEQASFRIQLQDLYGNPVNVHAEYLIFVLVDGMTILNNVTLAANEEYTDFVLTYNYAGAYTLTAGSNGILPGNQEITVNPADFDNISIGRVNDDPIAAGENLNFNVIACDEYGNIITEDASECTWTNATTGVFSKTVPGTYDVSAKYDGITSNVDTVTVVPAVEAAVVAADLADSQTAGEVFDISDTISGLQDRFGNLVTDGEYSVTVKNNDNVIFGPALVGFTGGAPDAEISINLTIAGNYTLLVQAGAAQDTSKLTIIPAVADKFVFLIASENVKAGEPSGFLVQVQDEYGNPTTEHAGYSSFVMEAEGMGTFTPVAVAMAVNENQSDFTWTCSQTGTYNITAAATGIIPAAHEITVDPSEPANLTVADLIWQSVGRPFTIGMSALEDDYGNIQPSGSYHLIIDSDLSGIVFEGDVTFTEGAWTQEITLLEEGVHTLTVSVNNITVVSKTVEVKLVPVTAVSIDQSPMTIEVEAAVQLSSTITPENASNQQVSWSSSNQNIAAVSVNGLVTGISVGTVVITATTADNGCTDTLEMIIEPADITGLGTLASPFIIYNFDGLKKIGTGKYSLSSQYRLGADIDASPTQNSSYEAGKGWKPISTFTGIFDGYGYKISNLKIYRIFEDYCGLFGNVGQNGILRNVALENVNIRGKSYTGGLVGKTYASRIEKCYVKGIIVGSSSTGGLVGWSSGEMGHGSIIVQSFATGSVTGGAMVGGLIGQTWYSVVRETYSTCTVDGSERVGGLVGTVANLTNVDNSYATGQLTATYDTIGGLVGSTWNYVEIANCYYDKETTGMSDTGKGNPRTTLQMQQGTQNSTVGGESMYTGWDWPDYWKFTPDTEYPILK